MSTFQLVIDVARCEGCNNCLMACKDEHVGNSWPGYTLPQQLHGDHWIRVPMRERGEYPLIDVAYRPTPCMHCDSPACARAVPGAIIKRADGIVLIDPEKARGRRELVNACPYGAIQWNEELQVPQKCTLCAHLLDSGWSRPRCVQACPTGALRFAKDGRQIGEAAASNGVETLHPEFNTRPTVGYMNLYKYAQCFVGGSVAARGEATEDCVKGASVTLCQHGVTVEKTMTDAFGDFRFDRLKRGEKALALKIEASGFQDRILPLDVLSESVNVGKLLLDRIARGRGRLSYGSSNGTTEPAHKTYQD